MSTGSINNEKMNQHTLQPTIRIGKNGLTDELIKEIKKQLKIKRAVKVKMLKAFIDTLEKKKHKKLIAAKIAEEAGAKIEGMTGFVFVLKKGGK